MYGIFTDTQLRGKLTATPVSGTILLLSAGGRQNPGSQLRSQHRGWLPGMACIKPVQPRSNKALLPADNGRRRSSQSLLNRAERRSFGQHQNQLRTENLSGRQGPGLGYPGQFQLLLFVEYHQINGHTR